MSGVQPPPALAPPVRNAWERNLAWARLLLGRTVDPATWYDLLGDRVLGADPNRPLANMGYWAVGGGARPSSLGEANDALFELVAGAAGLSPQVAHVVDVGCGFGSLTVRCVGQYGVRRATGVNLSTTQVAKARAQAERAGLSDRLEFVEASATRLPLADGSASAVVSAEAAFHFDSRAAFFREAARVLEPGGVLSMVDLLAEPPRGPFGAAVLGLVRRGIQMPRCNVVTAAEYRQEVERAGFEIERLELIEADVLPHFRRWFFRQPLKVLLSTYDLVYMLGTALYFFWPWRYVQLVARRKRAG